MGGRPAAEPPDGANAAGAACEPAAAASEATQAEASCNSEGAAGCAEVADLRLTVSMFSGRTASLTVPSSSTLLQLQEAVEAALQIQGRMQLLLGGRQLLPGGGGNGAEGAATLAEAGLTDGARLEVALSSSIRPMDVPDVCHLRLQSRKKCHSSAFTIRYDLRLDVPNSKVHVELWRRNDHDTLDFDTAKGVLEGVDQHWMCGNTPYTKALGFQEPLADLLRRQIEASEPVTDEAERFWREPKPEEEEGAAGPEALAEAERSRYQSYVSRDDEHWTAMKPPKHGAPEVQGSFVAPSRDCTELRVNVSMPFMKLARVLIDAEGLPVRVAVYTRAPNHDDVEEYLVAVGATQKEVRREAARQAAAATRRRVEDLMDSDSEDEEED